MGWTYRRGRFLFYLTSLPMSTGFRAATLVFSKAKSCSAIWWSTLCHIGMKRSFNWVTQKYHLEGKQQFNKQVHSDNDASEVDNSGHLRIFWHILGQFGGHFDEFGAFRLFSPLFPTIFTRYRLIRKKRVTDGRTDRRTDVRTDGQTLLIEMLGRN